MAPASRSASCRSSIWPALNERQTQRTAVYDSKRVLILTGTAELPLHDPLFRDFLRSRSLPPTPK